MGSVAKLLSEKNTLFAEVEVYRDEVKTLKKTNDELRKRVSVLRELASRCKTWDQTTSNPNHW